MTPEEVAKRSDNRAGYELITYREVGLPVFGVTASALVLEHQQRSCIEEFSLRFLAAGLRTSGQIQGILGLPESVVETTLADLVRQEAIHTTSGGSSQLSLTERGKQIVSDAELICPAEHTIWFPFDGLLRRPKWYGFTAMLKPNEARDLGIVQLKAIPARGPEVNELSAVDVSEVVRLAAAARRGEREVLRIQNIERRARQVLPAVALVYRALQGDELQVGFAIDGRISQEHEIAFARGGGLERQPIFQGLHEKVRLDPMPRRIAEFVEVAEAQRRRSPVAAPRSALDKAQLAVVAARSETERASAAVAEKRASEDLNEAEARLRSAPVRPVPVYEHPEILEQAVATAVRRLLIVSPWIRKAVVNDAFLQSLRRACNRGVEISIGYGLGDDPGERPQDKEARQALEKLSEELESLVLRRLGDTHAKVLVKDSEFFVITSFNWLSFRGDSSKPFREEWGTMVRDSALVDEFYTEIIGRFGP